jgi:hypothetical protein
MMAGLISSLSIVLLIITIDSSNNDDCIIRVDIYAYKQL